MSLKLMYITNEPSIAKVAEEAGVNWIFIDLETLGKEERQKGLDTVKSQHSVEDISKMKNILEKAELLVRINPLNLDTKNEIEKVIENGAEIIMLPYFKTKEEVEYFVKLVNGRAKVCLLLETAQAVENLDEILSVFNIDYIHIGLNDLHLSYKMEFMFEPLTNGIVEEITKKIKNKGIEYGFGGIASLGKGKIPAEIVITEHYRLDSTMTILSRSFIKLKNYELNSTLGLEKLNKDFKHEVLRIRNFESSISENNESFFERNRKDLAYKVDEITKKYVGKF